MYYRSMGKNLPIIELIPDLSHCIETVARREHAAILRQLLATPKGHEDLENRLEILRLFLKTADFKKLRAESEKQLTEGKGVRFLVYLEAGMPQYQMHVI